MGKIHKNNYKVFFQIEIYQLHTNKMDNTKEMDKFLKTHNQSRLNHKEIENPE